MFRIFQRLLIFLASNRRKILSLRLRIRCDIFSCLGNTFAPSGYYYFGNYNLSECEPLPKNRFAFPRFKLCGWRILASGHRNGKDTQLLVEKNAKISSAFKRVGTLVTPHRF